MIASFDAPRPEHLLLARRRSDVRGGVGWGRRHRRQRRPWGDDVVARRGRSPGRAPEPAPERPNRRPAAAERRPAASCSRRGRHAASSSSQPAGDVLARDISSAPCAPPLEHGALICSFCSGACSDRSRASGTARGRCRPSRAAAPRLVQLVEFCRAVARASSAAIAARFAASLLHTSFATSRRSRA